MSYPTTSSASDVWSLRDVYKARGGGNWPSIQTIPTAPVAGYIAWHTGDSISGSSWNDLSGNGNTATIGGSGASVVSTTGNGAASTFNVLQGTASTTVTFATGVLPSTYTLFHVARLTGGVRKRIFAGINVNWLSGFWSGNAGVAFHGFWLTPQTDVHGNNWLYSTDQKNLYKSNGVDRTAFSGSAVSANLGINNGIFSENSDFMVAEVIVYPSELSSSDILAVEAYLSNKYGI